MVDPGRTWMVLLREVTQSLRVSGQDRLMAALVLHPETGLVLGTSLADTAAEALAGAFEYALTRPAAELPPAPPARVVCTAQVASEVRKAIAAAGLGSPELIEAAAVAEAEDLFDSMVGHLTGRAQPDEPPSSEDWSLLVAQILGFVRAKPWARWSDVVQLELQVTVHGSAADYVAIVMGSAGVQHGLALYPAAALHSGRNPSSPKPLEGAPEAPPGGTLLLFLDEPGETGEEFARKALRYGWPRDSAYLPTWVCIGPHGPSDLSGGEAQRLQVALAAVVALDSRGPVLVASTAATKGRVALAAGEFADFLITQRYPVGTSERDRRG